MIRAVLLSALLCAPSARAARLRFRLNLRTCQETLSPGAAADLRGWIEARAAAVLGEVDHLMLSTFGHMDPEYAGRRAFAVDEVLELLGEQPPGIVGDHTVRRRTWQMRLVGEAHAAPRGIAVAVLGDRLRWDRGHLRDGEFTVAVHWEELASPELVANLVRLMTFAHEGSAHAKVPLRLVRAGDAFDGELYALVDVRGDALTRLLAALDLLDALQSELAHLAAPARRP